MQWQDLISNVSLNRYFSVISTDNWVDQWIWWLGPITAAVIQAIIYHVAPPYHKERAAEAARRTG